MGRRQSKFFSAVFSAILPKSEGRSDGDVDPVRFYYHRGLILLLAIEAGWSTFIRVTALVFTKVIASYTLFVIINYLTSVWNLSLTHAAGIINIWNGITPTLTFVFAIFADTYFIGSYYMLVLSSIAYTTGLGLLSLSTPVFFGPCNEYKEDCIGHKQKVLFFTALTLISVGQAGHASSLPPFIPTQKISDDVTEGDTMAVVFSPVLLLIGVIALSYIKPWSIQFGIPAICSLTATGFFLTGSYKSNIQPEQNPLTTALRVFVAAVSKNFQQVQSQSFTQIYNDDNTRSTRSLRCLDKAATKYPDQARSKSWTLCTVREVEDTKIGIRMVPMCLTFIVIGLVSSLRATYFIQQANHMDLKIGSKVEVRVTIILVFYTIFSFAFRCMYGLLCESSSKLQPIGIGVGMILSVLCCITAAIVETQRLHAIRDHGLLDKSNDKIPMSVFSLLPQFVLLAGADAIVDMSFILMLIHQLPERLHQYLLYFKDSLTGFGTMASVLLVYVVGKVSERNNNPNWFQYTSNKSRLDLYYWTLAVISAVNLIIYVIVAACFYTHNSRLADAESEAEAEADAEAVAEPEAEAKTKAEAEAGAGVGVCFDVVDDDGIEMLETF